MKDGKDNISLLIPRYETISILYKHSNHLSETKRLEKLSQINDCHQSFFPYKAHISAPGLAKKNRNT